MNYLKQVFSDARLRHQINKAVNECISTNKILAKSQRQRAKCASESVSKSSIGEERNSQYKVGNVNSINNSNNLKSQKISVINSCVQVAKLADQHPEEVLSAIWNRLNYSNAQISYSTLKLLETLVSSCNYSFHLSLSKNKLLHEKLLNLAIRRTQDNLHRQTQRLARLTLLQYSRMFIDDLQLAPLARLAGVFQLRTGKNLLRCLNIQKRKVKFQDPSSKDVIIVSQSQQFADNVNNNLNANGSSTHNNNSNYNINNCYSSNNNNSSSSSNNSNDKSKIQQLKQARVKPFKLPVAQVWACHVCGYLNAPSAKCCASCETIRFSNNSMQRCRPHNYPIDQSQLKPSTQQHKLNEQHCKQQQHNSSIQQNMLRKQAKIVNPQLKQQQQSQQEQKTIQTSNASHSCKSAHTQ